MNKSTAQAFWKARYKDKLSWEEINERIGYKIHRYSVHLAWRKYGLKVPKKYRKQKYDEIVGKLGIDTVHD